MSPILFYCQKRQTHDTGVETDLKQECRSGTHVHINKLRVPAWTQHGEASQRPACTWHWAPGLAPGPGSPLSCQGADGLCDLSATRQIHSVNLGTQPCERFWCCGAHPPISGQWAEGDSALPWASQCHEQGCATPFLGVDATDTRQSRHAAWTPAALEEARGQLCRDTGRRPPLWGGNSGTSSAGARGPALPWGEPGLSALGPRWHHSFWKPELQMPSKSSFLFRPSERRNTVMSSHQSFYKKPPGEPNEAGQFIYSSCQWWKVHRDLSDLQGQGRLNAERQMALPNTPETKRPPSQEVLRKMVLNRCCNSSCQHVPRPLPVAVCYQLWVAPSGYADSPELLL